MAPWIAAAISLLRSGALGAAAGAGALAIPQLSGGGADGFLEFPGLGQLLTARKERRRRRRRALTASDRADIGFITGLLGPTAGKNFAITIATRAT